jgi:hypothetical protein
MKKELLNSVSDRTILTPTNNTLNINYYKNPSTIPIEIDAQSIEFNNSQSVMGQNTEKTERLNGVDSKHHVNNIKENSTRTANKTCETCGW